MALFLKYWNKEKNVRRLFGHAFNIFVKDIMNDDSEIVLNLKIKNIFITFMNFRNKKVGYYNTISNWNVIIYLPFPILLLVTRAPSFSHTLIINRRNIFVTFINNFMLPGISDKVAQILRLLRLSAFKKKHF